MRVPESELELVGVEKRDAGEVFATYRLAATGAEYTAKIGTDDVWFRRVGATTPEPQG
jgi:hypothetical protein